MRITIVHRYFWPDSPPYASMLRSIGGELASSDDVEVFTSQPSYGSTADHDQRPQREAVDGVSVRRARLLPESKSNTVARVVNLVVFALQVFIRIIRSRPDAVMVATTPPILVAAAATLAARFVGAESVYHCQDIYPEVAEATGAMPNGRLARLLQVVDTATMRRSDRIVVLSEDMARTVANRDPSLAPKTVVINNFALDPAHSLGESTAASDVEIPRQLESSVDRRRVLFAGNLGNFQGLDAVLEAAVRAAEVRPDIDWVFLGRGVAMNRLQSAAGGHLDKTIHFPGHVSAATADAAIAAADGALVSLSPGVIEAAYPSKTLSYLNAGTPLIVVVEETSELTQMVEGKGLGVHAEPGDPEAILSAVIRLFDSPVEEMRLRCLSFGAKASSRTDRLADWSALFRELEVDGRD